MSKRSMTKYSGIPIIITERSGIRWGKRPTGYNKCVAGKLRGEHPGSRVEMKKLWATAVSECKGKGKFPALTKKGA